MKEEDLNKFCNVFRSMTGSTMTDEDIVKNYNSINKEKKKEIFLKIDTSIKDLNMPFDKALPLITVELNLLATEEQSDPAVLLLLYIDNLNKK